MNESFFLNKKKKKQDWFVNIQRSAQSTVPYHKKKKKLQGIGKQIFD